MREGLEWHEISYARSNLVTFLPVLKLRTARVDVCRLIGYGPFIVRGIHVLL